MSPRFDENKKKTLPQPVVSIIKNIGIVGDDEFTQIVFKILAYSKRMKEKNEIVEIEISIDEFPFFPVGFRSTVQ